MELFLQAKDQEAETAACSKKMEEIAANNKAINVGISVWGQLNVGYSSLGTGRPNAF